MVRGVGKAAWVSGSLTSLVNEQGGRALQQHRQSRGSGREQQSFQSNDIPLNLNLQADFVFFFFFFLPCDWHCLIETYSSKLQNSLIIERCYKSYL